MSSLRAIVVGVQETAIFHNQTENDRKKLFPSSNKTQKLLCLVSANPQNRICQSLMIEHAILLRYGIVLNIYADFTPVFCDKKITDGIPSNSKIHDFWAFKFVKVAKALGFLLHFDEQRMKNGITITKIPAPQVEALRSD